MEVCRLFTNCTNNPRNNAENGFLASCGIDLLIRLIFFAILFLVELSNVESFIDIPRNGSNFGAQLLFYAMQGKSVIIGDQVNRYTKVTEPATSSNPMQVSLGHLREVEVDDNIDSLNVDTTCEQI